MRAYTHITAITMGFPLTTTLTVRAHTIASTTMSHTLFLCFFLSLSLSLSRFLLLLMRIQCCEQRQPKQPTKEITKWWWWWWALCCCCFLFKRKCLYLENYRELLAFQQRHTCGLCWKVAKLLSKNVPSRVCMPVFFINLNISKSSKKKYTQHNHHNKIEI